jgi:glycosyltransferase involved in cell wall biosynthesis
VERLQVVGPDRFAYAPGFARAVQVHLRESDVAHVHSIFTYPVHATLREARALGTPVVLRPCGLLHRYSLGRSRLQKRIYLALWGRIVRRACSAWHYTSANESAESWPWNAGASFIVPNGIEPADFELEYEEARSELGHSLPGLGDAQYVLFLGRLAPKKRLDLLLEAFVGGAPPAFKLVVAGPDEDKLWPDLARRWLRDSAVAERIVRLDFVTGRLKALLLAGASLFALPSEHENFGIAALEALAAGTPVILSPHVDLSQAAVAAGVGYVAPLDPFAWRERLAKLLTDAAQSRADGARARAWAGENFAWEHIADRLVEQYRGLVAGLEMPPTLRRPTPAEIAG